MEEGLTSRFDQAVSHYLDTVLEDQKGSYSSNVETFEIYAEKFRKKAAENFAWIKEHFMKGHAVLLEEIEPALNPDETLDPYHMAEDALQQIDNHEKLANFFADSNSLHSLFKYSPKELQAFYKAAYKLVDDRRFTEGFDAYFFIITVAPHIREAWLNLGFTAFQLGDSISALEAYGRAQELDPAKADSYLAACSVFISQKQFEYAQTTCDIGIDYAEKHKDTEWAQELASLLKEAKNQIAKGEAL